MTLQRLSAQNPDFEKLNEMIKAMRGSLDNPKDASLSLEDLLTFQDDDGSFKLLDSYKVPSDARVDFCHTPTYIGAAILMRSFLSGKDDLTGALEQALNTSMHRELNGHGYDSEDGRIDAMNIFIKGGLREFLETKRQLCPKFHKMIHNTLHSYNSALILGKTVDGWNMNYCERWQGIVNQLTVNKRFYIAYGSNMDREQMLSRCPHSIFIGSTYIEGWQLTMPFYANIEPLEDSRTPALLWEINANDECRLNRCEGYPTCYDKTDIIVSVNGQHMSAMAYVMTSEYKQTDKQARDGYAEQIKRAYATEGFSEDEFIPH